MYLSLIILDYLETRVNGDNLSTIKSIQILWDPKESCFWNPRLSLDGILKSLLFEVVALLGVIDTLDPIKRLVL